MWFRLMLSATIAQPMTRLQRLTVERQLRKAEAQMTPKMKATALHQRAIASRTRKDS